MMVAAAASGSFRFERLDHRIMMLDHRAPAIEIGVCNHRPHLQPDALDNAGQHRHSGDLHDPEVKGLIELSATDEITARERLFIALHNSFQVGNILCRREPRSIFSSQTFQLEPYRADLEVACLCLRCGMRMSRAERKTTASS